MKCMHACDAALNLMPGNTERGATQSLCERSEHRGSDPPTVIYGQMHIISKLQNEFDSVNYDGRMEHDNDETSAIHDEPDGNLWPSRLLQFQ